MDDINVLYFAVGLILGVVVGVGIGVGIAQLRVNELNREVNTLRKGVLMTLDSLTFLHNRMDHDHTIGSVRKTLTNALADSND